MSEEKGGVVNGRKIGSSGGGGGGDGGSDGCGGDGSGQKTLKVVKVRLNGLYWQQNCNDNNIFLSLTFASIVL